MKVVSTIKNTKNVGEYNIYNSKKELIATTKQMDNGKHRIHIVGGICHGKCAYAQSFDDLCEKGSEIARLPR